MVIDKECGYYNEEINDEYSPYPFECEDCYRFDICLNAHTTKIYNTTTQTTTTYFIGVSDEDVN